MRPLCVCRLWLPVLLLILLTLDWMPKEQCYSCKKAMDFVDAGIRLRIDKQAEKSRIREAVKQRKVEEKRAKAAEAKERLAARRAQLEVRHRSYFVARSRFLTAYMQVEREASMPVTLEDVPSGRRQRRVPAKFVDMVPTSLKGLPHVRLKPVLAVPLVRRQAVAPIVPSTTSVSHVEPLRPPTTVEDAPDDDMDNIHPRPGAPAPAPASQPTHPTIDTPPNRFGVFRRYTTVPRSDPEEGLTLDAFADASTHLRAPPDPCDRDAFRPFGTTARAWFSDAREVAANSFAPFLNWTAFKLMEWQYTEFMTKSAGELQRLVNIVADDRFKKEDLRGFNVEEQQHRLDSYRATGGAFSAKDGWREGSVRIALPKVGERHEDEEHALSFDVNKIWYRPFVEVIRAAFTDETACKFHWFPHILFRKHATPEQPNAPPERLYTDVYNSDAMIREHEELQQQPPHPDDPPDVERVIAAIGVYPDSTHLANFGTASLWPIYAYFLNLSKYLRLKPTTFAAHHLAYIPLASTC